MWQNADVPRSDVHSSFEHLVVQRPTTSGQFDMWQKADVPRSDVPPLPHKSKLVVQSPTTPGQFEMRKNADVTRFDVTPHAD